MNCKAITKNGNQCRVRADDSGFCNVHKYQRRVLTIDDDETLRELIERDATIVEIRAKLRVRPHNLYRRLQRLGIKKSIKSMRQDVRNERKLKRRARDNSGCIYMFWLGFPGMYKIGFTVNWKQRIEALRASNPYLKPVVVFNGSQRVEKALHRKLADRCMEREIFQFDDKQQVVGFVKEIIAGREVLFIDPSIMSKTQEV